MACEMVANFEANVIGRQPPVNREHMREHGRVGRITALRLADDGVRGDIEEADGYDGALKGFDYLSPEVRWQWTNPYTGEQHNNVLFGAGATNYPFFLGRMAIHKGDDDVLVWDGEQFADSREGLRSKQDARAKRYAISVKEPRKLTPSQGDPDDPGAYGDPVNLRYPVTVDTAQAAVNYFNQRKNRAAGGYNDKEWSIIGRRIAEMVEEYLPRSYRYEDGRLTRDDEEASEAAFVHNAPLILGDNAERIVYGVILEPDTEDAQGHTVAAPSIEQACHTFMARTFDLDAHHARLIQSDEARVVESWIQREPVLWKFGDIETEVKPGSWCMAVKIFSDALWQEILDGEITGFSPKGTAVARQCAK